MPEGIRIVISLGRPLPVASGSLPAARPEGRWRCGSHLAAYLALLRLGVTVPLLLPASRWALTPPFHPYHRGASPGGGLFSVARSVASRRPGVTWQSTHWSSDFPRDDEPARDYPANPATKVIGLPVFRRAGNGREVTPGLLDDGEQFCISSAPLIDDRLILLGRPGMLPGSLERLSPEQSNPRE